MKRYSESEKMRIEEIFNEQLRKKAQTVQRFSADIKPYAGKLHNAGRIAFFEEYYRGIPLESQTIEPIGPIDDPRTTEPFMQGYRKGPFLVEIGAIPEEYKEEQKKHR